jgi:hypothetical protein
MSLGVGIFDKVWMEKIVLHVYINSLFNGFYVLNSIMVMITASLSNLN